MRKVISILLSITIMLTGTGQCFAAEPQSEASNPSVISYPLHIDGEMYGCEDSTLQKLTGDVFSNANEYRIIAAEKNAVKIEFEQTNGTLKSVWVPKRAFTEGVLVSDKLSKYETTNWISTYARYGEISPYGSIEPGKAFYAISNKNHMTQIIYSEGEKHKMGWVFSSDIRKTSNKELKYISANVIDFEYPVQNSVLVDNGKTTEKSQAYHIGVKVKAGNNIPMVYAAADGRVVYKGWSFAEGHYIILEHTVNGEIVYSIYSNLENITACPDTGATVSLGNPIGVYKSDSYVNFAICKGFTFYNPTYVVDNDCLPIE